MRFLARLEQKSNRFIWLLGFGLIGAIGIVDFLTGYEFAFSVFYVLPISLITWITGRRAGLVASLVCALTWAWADIGSGHPTRILLS